MSKRLSAALLAAAFAVVAHAQSPKPLPEDSLQTKIIQEVFDCLAEGLSPDWKVAWVNVLEISRSDDGRSRNFEANIRFATRDDDFDGMPLRPCDAQLVVKRVGDLNQFLKPEERTWSIAQMIFQRDGKFEVKYEYAPISPAPASAPGPAAAPQEPLAKPAPQPGTRPGAGFKLRTQ